MKFLTKKIVSFSFSLFISIYTFLQWYRVSKLCIFENIQNYQCMNIFFNIKIFSFYITLLVLPALLTLPFRQTLFESWKRFAVFAVPVILALTALLMLGDEGDPYISLGFGPFILMVLYGLYFFISLIIIIVAALRKYK